MYITVEQYIAEEYNHIREPRIPHRPHVIAHAPKPGISQGDDFKNKLLPFVDKNFTIWMKIFKSDIVTTVTGVLDITDNRISVGDERNKITISTSDIYLHRTQGESYIVDLNNHAGTIKYICNHVN